MHEDKLVLVVHRDSCIELFFDFFLCFKYEDRIMLQESIMTLKYMRHFSILVILSIRSWEF